MFIMINLFSSFDPLVLGLSLNWVSSLFCVMIFTSSYWFLNSQFFYAFKLINMSMKLEFSSLIKGPFCLVFNSIFLFLFLNNFMGLFPYIFTSSTHFVFSLGMSLPLWVGHILWSLKNQVDSILIHLTPLGTPGALQPFMVVIEMVSNIIRPLTLSIRLSANMIAGHLILTLIGSQGPSLNFLFSGILILVILMILLLECAVAVIQAYVFSILSTLYVKELDTLEANKLVC